jgi:hypothetical protein
MTKCYSFGRNGDYQPPITSTAEHGLVTGAVPKALAHDSYTRRECAVGDEVEESG